MNQSIRTAIGMLAFACLHPAPLHAAATAAGRFAWERRADSIALLRDGSVVWQFNHGTNQPKPFFHPLAVPGGPVLTANRPADHPWHHGLWFAWKYVNGLNYWEPAAGAALSEGRTEWHGARVFTHDDFSARIVMDLRYRPAGKDPVLNEERVVEVSAPDAQGLFHLDWTMTFTAIDQDVVLSRTPIPGEPDGVAWGGYAGLSVRLANALSEVRAVTSQGPIDLSGGTYRGRASAMDYAGTMGQREVGLAILDHPDNLNHPSPWYAIRDQPMRYFSPAVLCFQPHTLKAGQSLCLRYRVLVHPGRWDAAQLRRAVEQYTQASPRAAIGPLPTRDTAFPLPASFQVRPLPGQSNCVFTIYGTPGELEPLQQLVQVMREQLLGNGFDPGPTPHRHAKPIFDYLAGVGWPVICYPGCADMQVKGGRCVLGPESEAVLAALDRAGVFTAVQLGEWGYYFHNLAPNEPWWRDVYGKEFDQFKHLMKPRGLAGYDRRPASRRECYEVLQDYFKSRSRDLLGRVISVTGHSHYEAYAGEWGACCIGLEVGENIAFTQSKFAFARGAARQWRLPWSVQVSPWFSGACTTSGPLRREGGGARGLDAGHSLSFYERMWLHAWFAGAAMVTPENSIAIFFEKAAPPWTLTAHGRKASEVFQFMRAHERGVPFTPVAIVLDHLAGYNGYMDKPWGILEPTAGDRQVRDLFDHQLFPGSDHIHRRPDPANPESSYLRPTPYGELFDVQLASASADMLASYPVLLLAGDIQFDEVVVTKLEHALAQGSRLLLTPAHRAALGSRWARIEKQAGTEVLSPWTHAATGRSAAISDSRLRRLAREHLPVEITGDPIQYQVNRTTNGWVVELVNNAGVAKKPDQPATVDPTAIARVVLRPRIRCASARDWRSNRSYPRPDEIRLEVGPGRSEFIELVGP